jgi:hypothetical protein
VALTDAQKADTRAALGWSARFHQFDSRLEQAMSALDTEPDHEAQVIALIASVADIETKLLASHSRLKASTVGSIKLNPNEIPMLRKEGKRFVGQIASILGVETRRDIFSSSPNRTFASHGGTSGGGNYIGK